jgi:hypothetical protein
MNKRLKKSWIFQTFGSAACLLAVLAMLGGHWVVLQTVAWARMIGQYSHEGSLASAIYKTFDGRHPCTLCLTIQQGRQQEQQEQKSLPWVKLGEAPDALCEHSPAPIPLPLMVDLSLIPFEPQRHPEFLEAPPKPPPRVV